MCGIAGYINLEGKPLVPAGDERVLCTMGAAMESRGPDDTKTMLWGNVGFIFKRLSIVDIDGGQQPFAIDDGAIWSMTNGEIYNHRDIRPTLRGANLLRTQSDCEVIPHLYSERGSNMFDGVNGMFATALLDKRRGRLLLARDRLGIKPLFYCLTPDRSALVFASELKALFAHPAVPREFDWDNALPFNVNRSTRARELPSYFKGIRRVPAAHIVEVSLGSGEISVAPYWQPPQPEEGEQGSSADEYVARFRELLDDSVRLRLMSDVPRGVFLSGGVDSACIAALASHYQEVPTFSVSSSSTVGSGDVEASALVARHVGLVNHQVFLDTAPGALTPDHWREVLWACEFPQAGAEQLYKYSLHAFARARYPDLKVMLLGQGIDEYAGGYLEWTLRERRAWSSADWPKLAERMRQIALAGAASDVSYPWNYDGLVAGAETPPLERVQHAAPDDRPALALYRDYYRENLDVHLWHEDRTSSAHSIESRVPFLDHRLVELMSSIPERHHAALFTDKAILRDSISDLLPAQIARRPKGYFFYGKNQDRTFQLMHSLFVANSRELVEQAIAGSRATNGPIDADKLQDFVNRQGRSPTIASITRMQELINMGLLADMAKSGGFNAHAAGPLPVREIAGAELERMISEVSRTVPSTHEQIDRMIPCLALGVSLSPDGDVLSLPNGDSRAVSSSTWGRFLAAIDGSQTVGEIIFALGLPRSRTIRQLRSGMEEGVVEARHL